MKREAILKKEESLTTGSAPFKTLKEKTSKMYVYPGQKDSNFKLELICKRFSEMLLNMQEFDNLKLKGLNQEEEVIFADMLENY